LARHNAAKDALVVAWGFKNGNVECTVNHSGPKIPAEILIKCGTRGAEISPKEKGK
jgi:hypothetical protein